MRKIIFNSINKVRPLWRLLLFLAITFLMNIPLQKALQNVLPQGLLRGYISGGIYFLSVLFSLFIQIKYLDRSSFKKYGLKINKTWLKEFFVGSLFSLIQLSLFFVVLYMTGNLTITDFFTINSSEYPFNYSFVEGFFSELFGLIIGSSVEEIFFRAFLFYIVYEALRIVKKDPVKRAFLILFAIAPLFGIAHMDNPEATIISSINLGLDAVVICLPFLITGRLGMSIGMHLSWNLFQGAVFGFAVSGYIPKVNLISIAVPDNFITGGAFGVEGSVLFVLLDVIVVLLIVYWKKRNNFYNLVHPYILENDIARI